MRICRDTRGPADARPLLEGHAHGWLHREKGSPASAHLPSVLAVPIHGGEQVYVAEVVFARGIRCGQSVGTLQLQSLAARHRQAGSLVAVLLSRYGRVIQAMLGREN